MLGADAPAGSVAVDDVAATRFDPTGLKSLRCAGSGGRHLRTQDRAEGGRGANNGRRVLRRNSYGRHRYRRNSQPRTSYSSIVAATNNKPVNNRSSTQSMIPGLRSSMITGL